MVKVCPVCGAKSPDEYRFCIRCNAKLPDETVTPSATALPMQVQAQQPSYSQPQPPTYTLPPAPSLTPRQQFPSYNPPASNSFDRTISDRLAPQPVQQPPLPTSGIGYPPPPFQKSMKSDEKKLIGIGLVAFFLSIVGIALVIVSAIMVTTLYFQNVLFGFVGGLVFVAGLLFYAFLDEDLDPAVKEGVFISAGLVTAIALLALSYLAYK